MKHLPSLRVTGETSFHIVLLNHFGVSRAHAYSIEQPDCQPNSSNKIYIESYYSFLNNMYKREAAGAFRMPSLDFFNSEFGFNDTPIKFPNGWTRPHHHFLQHLHGFQHEHLYEMPYLIFSWTIATVTTSRKEASIATYSWLLNNSTNVNFNGLHFFNWKSHVGLRKERCVDVFALNTQGNRINIC